MLFNFLKKRGSSSVGNLDSRKIVVKLSKKYKPAQESIPLCFGKSHQKSTGRATLALHDSFFCEHTFINFNYFALASYQQLFLTRHNSHTNLPHIIIPINAVSGLMFFLFIAQFYAYKLFRTTIYKAKHFVEG